MGVTPLSTRMYQSAATPGSTPLPRGSQRSADFLLQRGPYPDRPEVWGLDLADNPFCPGESRGPGLFDDAIPPLDGLADALADELEFRSDHPKIVLIGQNVDPFLPLPEVQNELARVVKVLADRGIVAWFVTRGIPLPAMMDALAQRRHHVRVTVSLTSVDPTLQQVVEPDAAPAVERLALIAELRRLNIPVEVNLDPLLPGLTDARDKLWSLLEQLAAFDVEQVTAGYLVLRTGVRERLQAALEPRGWAELVLDAYEDGPVFHDGPNPAAQYLSKAKRQRGYAALMALASEFGISTQLSSLANPDFRRPRLPDTVSSIRARELIQGLRSSGNFSAASA